MVSGVFDPHKYTNADMCRIHAITYECLMEDEESQVRGFVHFADGAGVSFPHLTLFTPKEAVRIVKNGEVWIFTNRFSFVWTTIIAQKFVTSVDESRNGKYIEWSNDEKRNIYRFKIMRWMKP